MSEASGRELRQGLKACLGRLWRYALVLSGANDTAESLAAAMPVPERPVEHFLLLNGLEKSSDVKAGERYKVIAE